MAHETQGILQRFVRQPIEIHSLPLRNGLSFPLFGPTSQEALSMMGEALTVFLRCPSGKFLEACQ